MAAFLNAAILVAALCLAYANPIEEVEQRAKVEPAVNYRLPLHIKPLNYKITLKPYFSGFDHQIFTFEGECSIEIRSTQKTNQIRLHMKNLNISVSEYYKKGSTEKWSLPNAIPDSLTSIVVYDLKQELEANVVYILHYKYTGRMDEDMLGFYRSSYTTSKNVTKWLGSTQFQTHHARRVFPSFDEPKFKATFDLSLTRHRSLKTAGPTRIIEIKPDREYVTDIYNTTPVMSTYLLAFIFSEFNDRSDGKFGVLARPEYYSQTEYSFNIGKRILVALGGYLGKPYYLLGNDKMQMAAIPDFSAGAMENWGLLTYKEVALLYDEEETSLSSRQYITSAVAHEQAHMWFGDLVTCDWWSYTWLNEGFATYFAYFATNFVESNLNMDQQFVINEVQSVMGIDTTNAINPMSDENVKAEEDLARMFNNISYKKGGTVIRMTKHILGEHNFQMSLNEYLRKYKYNNTVPANLFSIWKTHWPYEFIQYADKYFSSFTTQVGYPVVTFNRTSSTNFVVSQNRFVFKGYANADPNLLYTVPITYTTSEDGNFNDTYPKFFLGGDPSIITVSDDTKWLIGNIQETGYYRVNYDKDTWVQIKSALYSENWGGIHELNRAQIVDDLLNFARAGDIDYNFAFDIIEYLKTETNYLPWASAFNAFSFLNMRLGNDTKDFAYYVNSITNRVYNELGFEEKKTDTTFDIYTRGIVLDWVCKLGNLSCIAEVKKYFNQNLKANPVPVNIRKAVYCNALRHGNEQDFNKLYDKFKTEKVATEKTLIMNSLGCVLEPSLVVKVFNIIISPEIRRQDKSSLLSSLYSSNNENVELVFDLVDQNIDQLAAALGDYSSVASEVHSIAARFTTEAQLEKLKVFKEKHTNKFGRSVSTLEKAVNGAKLYLQWSDKYLRSLKSFLAQHGKSGAAVSSISIVSVISLALITTVGNAFL